MNQRQRDGRPGVYSERPTGEERIRLPQGLERASPSPRRTVEDVEAKPLRAKPAGRVRSPTPTGSIAGHSAPPPRPNERSEAQPTDRSRHNTAPRLPRARVLPDGSVEASGVVPSAATPPRHSTQRGFQAPQLEADRDAPPPRPAPPAGKGR